MPQSRARLLFVINKSAGPFIDLDREIQIRNFFINQDYEIAFFFMLSENPRRELSEVIDDFKPQIVTAVGGDGTLSYVAKTILTKKIPLGLIPAGSANGMARELGIPLHAEKAMEIIINRKIRLLDVIRINEKEICLHLSDLGLNAHLVKYFHQSKIRGSIGYLISLSKALLRNDPISVFIQTKEKDLHTTALMVIIANASMYGTGAAINPGGQLDDGYFEVVIVHKIGISELLNLFLKFKRFDPTRIEIYHAKSAMLETERGAHFQIDGEYLGKVKKIRAEILPSQIKMIVP